MYATKLMSIKSGEREKGSHQLPQMDGKLVLYRIRLHESSPRHHSTIVIDVRTEETDNVIYSVFSLAEQITK
jgi:hypothetical protein